MMRHLELFSGIGGFRRAMDLLREDGVMSFENCGFSEIDPKASTTYCSCYPISPSEVIMGDIVAFTKKDDGFKKRMDSLGAVDIITGGFPCQSFSMMGHQAGFSDEERGQMFFRILDVVDEKEPRYLLLENVKNLQTHDKGRTLDRIKSELSLRGYQVFYNVFNSADFGLPQTRNRVLIFATKSKLALPNDFFNPKSVKDCFSSLSHCSLMCFESTLDLLSQHVPQKYFLSEKIKPTILSDGSANFKSKSEINLSIARPLTATMHKMHRACQDNYYTQNWIETNGKINPYLTCSREELAQYPIRKLTPQEAFMLQGFPSSFADHAIEAGVSDGALYRQAGNAVSVNTIYAILYYLIINKLIK